MIKLNETPVRTSRNFNINNIKLEDDIIPDNIGKFENIEINNNSNKIKIYSIIDKYNLKYGLCDILTNQLAKNANQSLKAVIDSKTNKELQIDFKFDNINTTLIDNIQIIANEDAKATVMLRYQEDNNKLKSFHNGAIRVLAKKNSNINVIIVNFMNTNSNNFISIENIIETNAKVNYTIVDFGGKHSITNYYSNLEGNNSENNINTIYLGKENQLFDLNYIGELRGEKSNISIEVQGALKDFAKKHFKGTIDFKKGCKKAKGNENEACMLLSDTARSIALPMLLCSEEDVEGNHSTSAGKVGKKELFYIMSRGFNIKEAMKLMVRAKFNRILENIRNDELKEEVLVEIEKRLD